jgi:hypothetical protein
MCYSFDCKICNCVSMGERFLIGMKVFDGKNREVKGFRLIAAMHLKPRECNEADRVALVHRRFGPAHKHPLLTERVGKVRSCRQIRRLLQKERAQAEAARRAARSRLVTA